MNVFKTKPNIIITSASVPFTRGGAEILVESLRRELEVRGFNADIVQLPFSGQPKESLVKQIMLWRSLELKAFSGKKVDLVIATKFPSYMVNHPCKSLWLVHQHRQLYDLYGTRYGDLDNSTEDEALRRMLSSADIVALKECQALYTISANVSARLNKYTGIVGPSLSPPLPLGNRYRSETPDDFILSVGRICSIKRVDMIVRALPEIHERLKLKIVGVSDEPAIDSYLKSEIDKHHLWHRVEFLGRVDDETLLGLYARAFAVYYAPFDEDYGYVTLESLASGRPVVTATDSGGTLEFIQDDFNGLVVSPDERSLALAFNRLYEDAELYERLSANAKESFQTSTWDAVIDALTSPLQLRTPLPLESTNSPWLQNA